MIIIMMLLVLIASFLLFGWLIRFSENIIRPSPAPPPDHRQIDQGPE